MFIRNAKKLAGASEPLQALTSEELAEVRGGGGYGDHHHDHHRGHHHEHHRGHHHRRRRD